MIELKPCPFCGRKAFLDESLVRGYEPAIYYEVRCSKCGQTRVHGRFDNVYKTKEWARKKAIEAWNKRPSPWHTGTLTEDGFYLVRTKGNELMVVEKNKHGLWVGDYFGWSKFNEESILLWQKIEPFKEIE